MLLRVFSYREYTALNKNSDGFETASVRKIYKKHWDCAIPSQREGVGRGLLDSELCE
jgi:hypothetical protein